VFRYIVVVLALASLPGSAFAQPVSLDQLLLQAREKNPELIAARHAWEVKQAEERPAGTWENPRFTYEDERMPLGMAGVEPQPIRRYRVDQMIPFPGKPTGEMRMKQHEALIAQADYRARMIAVDKEVRMRYYQLYLADQQVNLANQSAEILKNALRTAQSRLSSSQSSALDVFMVQTELAKAENAAFQTQQQRKLVQYELNFLLNQDPETPIGETTALPLTDLPLPLADFQALARHSDPLYLSSLHEINHARAMLRHHRLDYAPDFSVMAAKETSPGGPDGRMLGFSVSVPLWLQRPWKQVEGAKAHMSETEAKSQAMQNLVLKNVAAEVVETNSRLTVTRNYLSRILPTAGSALKIAQQRYASGQDDFMRLLEAYRAWITSHNEYQQMLYEYGEHWSALGQWLGVDVASAKQMFDQLKWLPEGEHDEHK
jgi:cobalt-zinc-cadmium efflux system outer membrane protein